MLSCDGVCGEDILRSVRRVSCALCDYDYCMTCAGGEEALLRRLPGSDSVFRVSRSSDALRPVLPKQPWQKPSAMPIFAFSRRNARLHEVWARAVVRDAEEHYYYYYYYYYYY